MSLIAKLAPLANRVLVRRAAVASQTAGGVYLPESASKNSNEGEVVAVGPGARDEGGNLIPMNVDVGDKVLLPEYGGSAVTIEEEEFFLFREPDILAKLME